MLVPLHPIDNNYTISYLFAHNNGDQTGMTRVIGAESVAMRVKNWRSIFCCHQIDV